MTLSGHRRIALDSNVLIYGVYGAAWSTVAPSTLVAAFAVPLVATALLLARWLPKAAP